MAVNRTELACGAKAKKVGEEIQRLSLLPRQFDISRVFCCCYMKLDYTPNRQSFRALLIWLSGNLRGRYPDLGVRAGVRPFAPLNPGFFTRIPKEPLICVLHALTGFVVVLNLGYEYL